MLVKSNFEIDNAVTWRNVHKGETAIVIGNGDSLNSVPRELLEKYPTFGCNHIYLLDFQPTYYVCVDRRILKKRIQKIYNSAQGAKIAFISDEHIDTSMPDEIYQLDNVYLCNERTIRFDGEFWWTGGTVTYFALKIAYVMGFETVILVGCDRDKEWKYFSNDYPAEYTPKQFLRKQEYHLGIAGIFYKENGRRIINLSLPSVLDEYYERGMIEDYA